MALNHDPAWHPLIYGNPPAWASGWGEDRFGIFVEITIHNVVQRLRWIPPGEFLMGSSEGEPERFSDEGPQHQVILEQGFWLFDTACTQALWQEVMGDNPSQFKSPKHPVEQVSFGDVQNFLQRINSWHPGLELTLPSEAQWEYACRAGTTTPFSFGANITPAQVNYNGNFPYANGAKGKYRETTVPVASLPANHWGLYEMHGNVWEWCADVWHDSYEGAPTDGSARVGPSADRVVRGGSWNSDARFVRAAYRGRDGPAICNADQGFRCARVQS